MWRAGIYSGIRIKSSNIVRYIPARHSFSLARFKTETKDHANDFASMLELSSKVVVHSSIYTGTLD